MNPCPAHSTRTGTNALVTPGMNGMHGDACEQERKLVHKYAKGKVHFFPGGAGDFEREPPIFWKVANGSHANKKILETYFSRYLENLRLDVFKRNNLGGGGQRCVIN